MLRSFFILLFALSFGNLSGQIVTIHGQATDYAGKELIFYTFPEPISHQSQKLAETKVGADGVFNLTFTVDQSIEIYADLEKFRGTMVVEPGAQYQITLPPFSLRTSQETASPYFEPELFWLGIKGVKSTDLNFLVRAFLTDYNKELTIHTRDLYQKKSADTVKAIIARLDKSYPTGNNYYLNTLKIYSFAEAEHIVNQPDKEYVSQKYLQSKIYH